MKLREALHRFQKETMTDELASKFTYWGRTANSIPFYKTRTAKVFFRKFHYFLIKPTYHILLCNITL